MLIDGESELGVMDNYPLIQARINAGAQEQEVTATSEVSKDRTIFSVDLLYGHPILSEQYEQRHGSHYCQRPQL